MSNHKSIITVGVLGLDGVGYIKHLDVYHDQGHHCTAVVNVKVQFPGGGFGRFSNMGKCSGKPIYKEVLFDDYHKNG